MTIAPAVLSWLLASDAAVAYQARRDLLGEDDPDARRSLATSGTAAAILARQREDGHWGEGFYQPKWTSTHYSLLELRSHQVAPDLPACGRAVALCLAEKSPDGGVNPAGTVKNADVCVNGMVVAIASYFGASASDLQSVITFLLGQQLGDGGFNCRSNRSSGCRVSSVHTTTSVIDGFSEYLAAGYPHEADAVRTARDAAVECLLSRSLYRRKSTGEPVHPDVVRLHDPARWHFDILRGLEVVTAAGATADARLAPALSVLADRRRQDRRWAAASGYPGVTHVRYPRAGTPNPWVTLRALRVLARVSPSLAEGSGRREGG